MSTDPPNWIGAAVTALCAVITGFLALIRRILISVTREEMLAALKAMEDRHQAAEDRRNAEVHELRRTILSLHEDNVGARHRLRETLASPINHLNAEIIKLRQSIEARQPPREAEE